MQEILIPKILITLFLFVSIIRPFIRKLKAVNGLAWLPVVALLLLVALVPAYGFRPETFPLFVYAAVLSGITVTRLLSGGGYRNSRKEPLFIFALPLLAVLAAAAWTAFSFSPQKDTALTTQGVYTLREGDHNIRIYTERTGWTSRRPLLVMLPPALGSLAAVDHVAAELRDQGFTVLSSGRANAGPAELFSAFNAFFSGTNSARANARGRSLEDARKDDLRFLLSWIGQNPQVDERTRLFDIASADAVFLAGYGAGGSALLLLEGSLSFGLNIRGLIAIESSLWSAFREYGSQTLVPAPGTPTVVIPYQEAPPAAGWFNAVRQDIGRRISEMGPQRIAGLEQVPRLSTPVLFMVSDRSRDSVYQSGRYRALLETFRSARSLAVLASADGAGPLDFSDIPVRYPIISALFPGLMEVPLRNIGAPAKTAAVITNFADRILGEASTLQRQSSPAGFQIESRNQFAWSGE